MGPKQQRLLTERVSDLENLPGGAKSLPDNRLFSEVWIMRVRSLVLALALLLPATAFADPIMPGNGSWLGSQTPIPNPSEAGATIAPFWSGLSWDCTLCGVGYMLENYGYDATRLEYLQDGSGRAVSFRFDWDTPIFDFSTWAASRRGRTALSTGTQRAPSPTTAAPGTRRTPGPNRASTRCSASSIPASRPTSWGLKTFR